MWRTLAIALLVAGVVAAALYGTRKKNDAVERLSCDPLRACTFSYSDSLYTMRFAPSPKPLEPFAVVVTGAHKPISVAFEMLGMQMGENRFSFQRQANGIWRAEALLPVCVSGRSDWRAVLRFENAAFEFAFALASR